jgi:hypothetical protein
MADPTRKDIFERAARKLRADFAELANVPHKGEKGAAAEKLVRRFLNAHLPRRFAAEGGFVIDRADSVSKQMDVVVYDAFNCPVYRADEDAGIFPSDNVAAVVEVKSRLDADRLQEAVDNIAAAKRLKKSRGGAGPESFLTLGCLFAFESALTLETLSQKYVAALAGTQFGLHIDVIVVLDRGLVTFVANAPGSGAWSTLMAVDGSGGDQAEGFHVAVAPQEFGDRSLDAFLRLLLAHLALFRHTVDHPGFDWAALGAAPKTKMFYLTSLTVEQDPARREAKLRAYREDFERRFSRT